ESVAPAHQSDLSATRGPSPPARSRSAQADRDGAPGTLENQTLAKSLRHGPLCSIFRSSQWSHKRCATINTGSQACPTSAVSRAGSTRELHFWLDQLQSADYAPRAAKR